ncbi:MAG: DUF502 domain-containing protein [Candidatus Brocadiia bacterium]
MKKHLKIFVNGIIVVAPAIITIYVLGAAIWWLDQTIRKGIQAVWADRFAELADVPYGVGILIGLGGIYLVGLLARTWLLRWPLNVAESLVERIPLVKSLYSSVRDLLQFLGGAEEASRGKPCVVRSEEGNAVMLGLITQEEPERFLPGDPDRIAVYLPMSYQLGGYTLYVPPDRVEKLPDTTVEELLKLCLTAGVGTPRRGQRAADEMELPGAPEPESPSPTEEGGSDDAEED